MLLKREMWKNDFIFSSWFCMCGDRLKQKFKMMLMENIQCEFIGIGVYTKKSFGTAKFSRWKNMAGVYGGGNIFFYYFFFFGTMKVKVLVVWMEVFYFGERDRIRPELSCVYIYIFFPFKIILYCLSTVPIFLFIYFCALYKCMY